MHINDDIKPEKSSFDAVEHALPSASPDSLSDMSEEERAAKEKKLVRKIDLFLLPCIWIVYMLSYMVHDELRSHVAALLTTRAGSIKPG